MTHPPIVLTKELFPDPDVPTTNSNANSQSKENFINSSFFSFIITTPFRINWHTFSYITLHTTEKDESFVIFVVIRYGFFKFCQFFWRNSNSVYWVIIFLSSASVGVRNVVLISSETLQDRIINRKHMTTTRVDHFRRIIFPCRLHVVHSMLLVGAPGS